MKTFEQYLDYCEDRSDRDDLPSFEEWQKECEEEAAGSAATTWEIDNA